MLCICVIPGSNIDAILKATLIAMDVVKIYRLIVLILILPRLEKSFKLQTPQISEQKTIAVILVS